MLKKVVTKSFNDELEKMGSIINHSIDKPYNLVAHIVSKIPIVGKLAPAEREISATIKNRGFVGGMKKFMNITAAERKTIAAERQAEALKGALSDLDSDKVRLKKYILPASLAVGGLGGYMLYKSNKQQY